MVFELDLFPTYMSHPPPNDGPLLLELIIACVILIIGNKTGLLLGLVKLNKNAFESVFEPPDDAQEALVYPPNMYPLDLIILKVCE